MISLEGIFVRQVTPFHSDGRLDLVTLQTLLQRHSQAGISGVVLLGEAGEASTLTRREKEELIDSIQGLSVLVDVGLDHSELSLFPNASALILRPTQIHQKAAYKELEALSDLATPPLIIDNSTGALHPLTLREVAALSNVAGVIASSDPQQLADCLHYTQSSFALFTEDSTMLSSLALGAKAVLSLAANALAPLIVPLYEALMEGELQRARSLFFRLLPLFKAFHIDQIPVAIKEAMRLLGQPAGPCRSPLLPLERYHRETLAELLVDAQLMEPKVQA